MSRDEQLSALFPTLDTSDVVHVEEVRVCVAKTADNDVKMAVSTASGDEPTFPAVFAAAAMLTNIAARTSSEGFERTLDLLQSAATRVTR